GAPSSPEPSPEPWRVGTGARSTIDETSSQPTRADEKTTRAAAPRRLMASEPRVVGLDQLLREIHRCRTIEQRARLQHVRALTRRGQLLDDSDHPVRDALCGLELGATEVLLV